MASTANRRPVMTLYSRSDCPLSHRVRIVLAEKNITADIIDVDIDHLPEDLQVVCDFVCLKTCQFWEQEYLQASDP